MTLHGGRLFAIARARGWDWREVLDFSASINPLGPSPAVFDAIQGAMDEVVHYPECHPRELHEALACAWQVDPDQLLLGNGATDLIHFLAPLFRELPPTIFTPAFSEFHRVFPHAALTQSDLPESGLTIVTRPLNPTGELPQLEGWLERTTHPVIVDESFIEFAEVPSIASMIARRGKLVVLRSLTKFHGIPGLRIGALVGPPQLISAWKRLRDPWSVNVFAIRAACASLADTGHSSKTLHLIRAERAWLSNALGALPGVFVHPSVANFLYVRLAYSAAALTSFLEQRKILIRDCTDWPGLEGVNGVRVAVRTRPENEELIANWKEFSCD
jgi:threonine-phosphate decarboxylase